VTDAVPVGLRVELGEPDAVAADDGVVEDDTDVDGVAEGTAPGDSVADADDVPLDDCVPVPDDVADALGVPVLVAVPLGLPVMLDVAVGGKRLTTGVCTLAPVRSTDPTVTPAKLSRSSVAPFMRRFSPPVPPTRLNSAMRVTLCIAPLPGRGRWHDREGRGR
jgi:hypothetical protein